VPDADDEQDREPDGDTDASDEENIPADDDDDVDSASLTDRTVLPPAGGDPDGDVEMVPDRESGMRQPFLPPVRARAGTCQ
jgi:hypothetical protein